MNAQVKELEPIGELSVVERASRALSKAESEARLIELAQSSKALVSITDNAERERVHEARMGLKEIRIRIEKTGKAAREDATAYSKAVIAEEKRLIGLIQPEESRLDAIQTEWDDRKEKERQARIAAEEDRVKAIQERIAILRGNPILTPSSGSRLIGEHISDLESIPIDDTFEEWRQQADDAKTAGIARLRAILHAAIEHEAEQARIIAEREELAKLRAEAQERERIEAEKRAQTEAAAKAERDREAAEAKAKADAEAARVAEENRLERERIAKERAENERIAREAREKAESEAKAERDRIAAEEAALKAVRDLEAAALAAERAEFDRQRAEAAAKAEAARLAAEEAARPKPRKKRSAMPTKEIILQVLVDHFEQPEEVIAGWLSIYFGSAA